MTESKQYLRSPALSPDGHSLAFLYAGDIWLADLAGHTTERLTAHPAGHHHPRFSPDGSALAFSSTRTGGGDVYVLPLGTDAGAIQRLTYHDRYSVVEDWSADGQAVFFTANREQQDRSIYRVPLAGGTPVLVYAEPYETLDHVRIAPSGDLMAFNITRSAWWRRMPGPFAPCDIWVGPARPFEVEAGEPATLPLRKCAGAGTPQGYRGLNRWPLWAPDGQGIYFVSDRDGTENIWYQSLEGDELRQVTRFRSGRLLWPDMARQTGRIVFEHEWAIWQLDPASGEAEPLPLRVRADTKLTPAYVETRTRGLSELRLAPDGKKVAFVTRGEVFADFADKETNKEQRQGDSFRVTNTWARENQVVWTPDSRSLIYVSDRHGEPEIYRYDFPTRRETRLTDDPTPKAVPRCSPDGAWVAYFAGTDTIALLNLKTGEQRAFAQGSFLWMQSLAWSPDSQWLAYLSHDARFFGNVYVQRLDETSPRQITFLSNIMADNLLWAPNGRFLIFTSGQYRIESQIVRVELRPPEPFFREAEFDKLFEEPQEGRKEQARLGQAPEQATDEPDPAADDAATRSSQPRPEEEPPRLPNGEPPAPDTPDGLPQKPDKDEKDEHADKPQKSDKEKVEPVVIVFAGIERRLRFLTPLQMDADAQAINPTSRDLLFRAVVADKINIWSLPLDEPRRDQPPRQLTVNSNAKRDIQFAPDGKTFFYLEDGQIVIRKFPQGNEPVTLQVRAEVLVDFHAEKLQVFHEAWRLMRDTFYDPSFGGQDWNRLRDEFAPLIEGAQSHAEILLLINRMLGELRASHTGTYWYGSWPDHDGYTGLLFDPIEQAEQGRLRIVELVPDSPVALLPNPPRVGEYLVAVDGVPLTAETSLDYLLQRTSGRRVRLGLAATPAGDDARDVAIRPIDSDTYGRLRYRTWVNTNEAYVHRVSEGRLGYVHIPEMSYGAYLQFLVDIDTETHSQEGIVLDIRYNSGGHIATFILDVLTRRNVLRTGFRNQLATDAYHLAGNRTLNKPTVLVTNEGSVSNAEIFTEIYRRLGLGKVVGKPTAGRVIGTTSYWLLNGSYLRLPMYGYVTPEGEGLEGIGRQVDIDVDRPVGEWRAGRDQQLDAAVAALLEVLGS